MELDFDKISLSKNELKALLLLEKHNLIPEDGEAKVEIQRLNRLEFSAYFRTSVDHKPRIGVHITDTGKDYLMYLREKKEQKKKESVRYWITTGIAVAALIKAFLPEICAGLAWLSRLLGPQ